MNHRDEKGQHAPAQSKVAKSMRGNGNGNKAKKIEKMEKVRRTEPKLEGKAFKDVEKSGSYRHALARNLKRARA